MHYDQQILSRLAARIETALKGDGFTGEELDRIAWDLKVEEKRVILSANPRPKDRDWIVAHCHYVDGVALDSLAGPACVTAEHIQTICDESVWRNFMAFARTIEAAGRAAASEELLVEVRSDQVYLKECCRVILRSRFTPIPSNSVDWTKSLFLEGPST